MIREKAADTLERVDRYSAGRRSRSSVASIADPIVTPRTLPKEREKVKNDMACALSDSGNGATVTNLMAEKSRPTPIARTAWLRMLRSRATHQC